MRIFLDANILFSAALSGSRLYTFLDGLRLHAVLMTNAYAAAESARNIAEKYPSRLATHDQLVVLLELVPVREYGLEVPLTEKDRPILCGAWDGNADFLLTGDKKDFGHLFGMMVRNVKVVSVQMLLAELLSAGIILPSD